MRQEFNRISYTTTYADTWYSIDTKNLKFKNSKKIDRQYQSKMDNCSNDDESLSQVLLPETTVDIVVPKTPTQQQRIILQTKILTRPYLLSHHLVHVNQ